MPTIHWNQAGKTPLIMIEYKMPGVFSTCPRKDTMTAVHCVVVIVIIALAVYTSQISACTAFCIQKGGQPVVGRNYDWGFNECIIFINKSGLSKAARQFDLLGRLLGTPAGRFPARAGTMVRIHKQSCGEGSAECAGAGGIVIIDK